MNPTRERSSHPSSAQIEAMLDFLEQNPGLVKGFLKTQHAREQSRVKWEQLSLRLNSMGGAMKSYKQWTKYWTDKRSALKKKVAARNAARRRTGGGVEEEIILSEMEERMVALCGGEGFSIGDPHVGIQLIVPSPLQQIPIQSGGPTNVFNVSHESAALEDEITVMESPAHRSGIDNSRTVRRLFNSPDDIFAPEITHDIVHSSPVPMPLEVPEFLCLSPPPPTLSHTPTPVSMPTSPSHRGLTTSACFLTSARRGRLGGAANSSSSRQAAPPTPNSHMVSPSRRGSTASSRQTARISRHAGSSSAARQGHSFASPPSQRRTEFSRITDRFLRVAEQQVEVQQSNASVMQTMVELSTGRDRNLVEAVTAMGERIVDRICERDRVLADAVSAMGEGLRALAEVAKSFNPRT